MDYGVIQPARCPVSQLPVRCPISQRPAKCLPCMACGHESTNVILTLTGVLRCTGCQLDTIQWTSDSVNRSYTLPFVGRQPSGGGVICTWQLDRPNLNATRLDYEFADCTGGATSQQHFLRLRVQVTNDVHPTDELVVEAVWVRLSDGEEREQAFYAVGSPAVGEIWTCEEAESRTWMSLLDECDGDPNRNGVAALEFTP